MSKKGILCFWDLIEYRLIKAGFFFLLFLFFTKRTLTYQKKQSIDLKLKVVAVASPVSKSAGFYLIAKEKATQAVSASTNENDVAYTSVLYKIQLSDGSSKVLKKYKKMFYFLKVSNNEEWLLLAGEKKLEFYSPIRHVRKS